MSQADPPPAPTDDSAGNEEPLAPLGAGFDFTDPNSPLAAYYLRAAHLAAVALLGLVALLYGGAAGLYGGEPLWHTDVWGHLKFGEWMVANRALPDREPFCPFADQEAPYVHFQWLSQAGLYLAYRLGEGLAGGDAVRRLEGGVESLRTGQVLLVVACYLLALLAYRRASGSLPLACAGLVVLFALKPALFAFFRPQAVGLVFFAALLLALSRPVLSRRAVVLVPLLVVVWANAHGSFAVGLALVGICLAGRAVEACREARSWDPRRAWGDAQVRRLSLVLLTSTAAAALLNPHGPLLYLHVLRLGGHPNIATLREWQPLQFALGPGGHVGYLLGLALLVATQALSPRWLSPTQLLLLLTFGLLPLWQMRMTTWWAVLVAWVLLPHWAAIGARLPWGWLHVQSVPCFRKTIVAALLVAVVLLASGPVRWLLARRPRPVEVAVSPGTPWRVAAQLAAPPGAPRPPLPALAGELEKYYPGGRFAGRVFASETQGDYLLWALPPEYPVLLYTHAHLFPPGHWADCLTVLRGQEGWAEVLDRHAVNLVVLEPGAHFRLRALLHDDPRWVVVPGDAGGRSALPAAARTLVALRKEPKTP